MKLEGGELRHCAGEAATHERRMATSERISLCEVVETKGMSERSGNLACEVKPNEGDEYPPGAGRREEEVEKKGNRK